MNSMDIDMMSDEKDLDSVNEALEKNPAWQKVRRLSVLQDVFLCVSLGSAIIYITFDVGHPYWCIAFLIAGLMSLVFGGISMKNFQEHFARKDDITEEVEKGNNHG